MYKNPLNNGDISDNNSLKKQRDYGPMIDKYKKKLPIKPTELQKYYQYLTYQQPILDEANYVAERMRTEDINKKNDDYVFVENLKQKREEEMKKLAKNEEMIKAARDSLFEPQPKNDDLTPVIITDIELEIPKTRSAAAAELFGDGGDDYPFDEASIADTVPIKKDLFELSREEKEKPSKAKKKREGRKKNKEAKKQEEIKQEEEKAAIKIENAILAKVKRNRAKKELVSLKMNNANDVLGRMNDENDLKKKLNASVMANDMINDAFAETLNKVPEKKKRGRPAGSKKKIKK
jgi:hypothetical protein